MQEEMIDDVSRNRSGMLCGIERADLRLLRLPKRPLFKF
jgi:hypothetical protein